MPLPLLVEGWAGVLDLSAVMLPNKQPLETLTYNAKYVFLAHRFAKGFCLRPWLRSKSVPGVSLWDPGYKRRATWGILFVRLRAKPQPQACGAPQP